MIRNFFAGALLGASLWLLIVMGREVYLDVATDPIYGRWHAAECRSVEFRGNPVTPECRDLPRGHNHK